MIVNLEELAESVDFRIYSCLACVIMSHGGENYQIYGLDWRSVRLDHDIINIFRDCERLLGKPKLFFVQACRGGLFTKVVEVDNEREDEIFDYANQEEDGSSGIEIREADSWHTVSKLGDVLVHFSTMDQYLSVRNKIKGSCFICSLCSVFDNNMASEPVEIDRLLRKVNNIVVNTYKCQQPEYKNSLNKLCFLNSEKP
jgi:hypothetical protein